MLTSQLLTPRRLDIVVKHRYFLHFMEKDENAATLYRWHIQQRSGHRMAKGLKTDQWKRSVQDYELAAKSLFKSMEKDGFVPTEAIPIDPDGEILNGSHRVACALALGITDIPVEKKPQHVFAPPWGYEWFQNHGLQQSELMELLKQYYAIKAGTNASRQANKVQT